MGGRRLGPGGWVGLLALLALVVGGASAAAGGDASPSTPAAGTPLVDPTSAEGRLRTAIAGSLDPDTKRGGLRLPSVRLDQTGDLTVVYALRDEGSVEAIRAAALSDLVAILRAVYAVPAGEVRTTTVVGTFSVTGTRGARELRVLRVVLSAERAERLDWATAQPADLVGVADAFRFYPPFGDEAGRPIVAATPPPPGATPPTGTPAAAVISSPVDIGGRLLFLRCIGSGGPTVILEGGYGDDGTIWAPVQLRASEFVRVCSYDRPGLHRSDPPDRYPRTAADVVADLHTLLTNAGIPPPYVLVGHSHGALYTRLYAATHPDEVAGLVLIDPWPEQFDARLRALVSPEQWTAYQAQLAEDPDYEVIDLEASYAQVRAAGPLPPVPLLVLSHGRPPDPACCPPGWPLAEQERLWQELQAQIASLVPGSEHQIVAESGHMIHQAQPDVVIEAIRTMVATVRDPVG